ncbi:MAG: tRNA dihydrouridine(20/20a) synthase DusA [Hyphomicrobiales bacterium]
MKINQHARFSVAPMMDWTDRHCRYFHRQLSAHALLYTEMVTADAIIHGDRERLLGFSQNEHPVALQLGGSEPEKLALAAKIGADFGYDEINLNVGCPSDRVQSGTFGACLMREPQLVGDCVKAMKEAVTCPVTVKCRIGVDEQDTLVALDELANAVVDSGVDALWVHARKAWLEGLSPKQNRDVPPLDYERVYALKQRLPDVFIGINGGISTLDEASVHLEHVDGVMLGRAAYQDASLLTEVDNRIYGQEDKVFAKPFNWQNLCDAMMLYCDQEMAKGVRLSAITRHMIGLFHGLPGARRYRQILSEEARLDTAKPEVIERAFGAVVLPSQIEDVA